MKNCQETKKKKVNKIRIKERLQMVTLLCCASLATSISPVFADKIGDAANSAATGIQQSAVGLVKPLIIMNCSSSSCRVVQRAVPFCPTLRFP